MALNNDQYKQILREYDERRFQNKYDLDKRIEEVYKVIPRLKELDDEIISLSAESGRRALFGDTEALEGLKVQTKEIKSIQEQLLITNGYPMDYLSMQYQCSRCKDTGFIDSNKCKCLKQAIADMIYEGSNIKSVLERENFTTFSFKYYSDDYIDETIGLSPLSICRKLLLAAKALSDILIKNTKICCFLAILGRKNLSG